METVETDVLVVGAGPAGLAAANLLAAYGVAALTVTKYASTANSPRAHITNQRAVEVFRDLGIEDAVLDVATPNELMGNNVWATSFAGPEIARLLTWGTSHARHADYAQASPCSMCNVPQHILEPVLRTQAEDRGAQIWFNSELTTIDQDETRVRAVVTNRESGDTTEILAQYVIAADGGRSTIADQLGFPLTGEMGLGAAVNVWLEADLSAHVQHRPGTLYWMCQPGNDYWVGSGTWICVKPWTEWVLLFMYDPHEGLPDMTTKAVTKRAQVTIGDPDVEVHVKSVSTWQINHMAADQLRMGRVFLVGDAAHRHPPANGLGTNTSIQDSFNLAWKLAYVLSGTAGDRLLDTYDEERQPVARSVVDRAMKSVRDMLPISQALGFEPGQTADEGWAQLNELFSATSEGETRRRALAAAVELQNYQFNAHGVEMGQRYESSGIVEDGSDWPTSDRDAELYYQPTTHAGSVLPHAWVSADRRDVSTIDLVGHGAMTLVVGPGGKPWEEAAATVSQELGIKIVVVGIGPTCPWADVYGDWERVREISDSGALLVRPDRHIAWRQMASSETPAAELTHAVKVALARD